MDRLYFEVPGIGRKDDAIAYINEFYEYQSDINGVGGLHRFLDNYEGWLEKLEADYVRVPGEEKVPARTYFLVRESDRRIQHPAHGAGQGIQQDQPVSGPEGAGPLPRQDGIPGRGPGQSRLLADDGSPGRRTDPGIL